MVKQNEAFGAMYCLYLRFMRVLVANVSDPSDGISLITATTDYRSDVIVTARHPARNNIRSNPIKATI